jgi:shikimate dehydrogenase
MSISGSAMLAGIVGWPVAQSLSPRLHGFWLNELGLDGAYVPLAVRPEDFSTVVLALRHSGFKGVNVTIPHKEAAFAICHECDLAARIAGAANLLIFHGKDRIEGRNSDAAGLTASLREHLGADSLRGKTVVILGAGGAARAAAVALHDLGAGEIRIVNRSRARADVLADSLGKHITPKILAFGQDELPRAANAAALVIHATSAGMKGSPSLELPLDALPRTAWFCDIVYNPLDTELLKRARKAGFKTIDGLGMLMHQAVPAFEALFGVKPKVTPALREDLQRALSSGD